LEWAGLLYCCNHPEPLSVSSHASGGEYRCRRDFLLGRGAICLTIDHRFIDEPLSKEVLRQLDFTPYAEEVLTKLESEAAQVEVEGTQRRRQLAKLERILENLKPYLGCGDPEREDVYWEQYRSTKRELEELRAKPLPARRAIAAEDLGRVRGFLAGLPHNWGSYPTTLRNRLLKLLIKRVELRHEKQQIAVAIIWKAGFEQHITIYRPHATSNRENRWADEENCLLRMLWRSASREVVQASLPDRTWSAITNRARSLGLKREKTRTSAGPGRRWTSEEEARGKVLYQDGTPVPDMVAELNRSERAIFNIATKKRWCRPAWARWTKAQVTWQTEQLKVLQAECLSASMTA